MKKTNISIIIATYNRKGRALSLIHQIQKLAPKAEVIIVDQRPTIKNITISRKANIVFVTVSKVNLPYARNIGAKIAQHEIVLYLDDDVILTKETIKAHIGEYRNNKVIGVAGRVINDGENHSTTNVLTGKMNQLGTKFAMSFYSTKKQFVDFPYGCNMSFNKKALLSIGGFDEKFVPPLSAFEEIDIALRLKSKGKIIFSPKTLVYHKRAKKGGTRLAYEEKMKSYYQSYGYFLTKHVRFPLSFFSFVVRGRSAISESLPSIFSFARGYFQVV